MNREATYLNTVQQWLIDFGVRAECTEHAGYAVLRSAKATLVLDYMPLPYQKPKETGFHFGIDYFLFHQHALKSRLASIYHKTKPIFARNCTVERIDKQAAATFFNNNHLSGYANAKFKYGLFHANQLVAAITFAPGRNILRNGTSLRSFEMIGFCQISGYTVTGGLSKLIHAFVADKSPQHIATTVDLDWATGKGLHGLGFSKTEISQPLPFAVEWQAGQRLYPDRHQRFKNTINPTDYPYLNAGFAKFEHFYTPLTYREL